MSLHQSSGETRLGVALASVTMLMWGTLPIALAILFDRLEPETLVWFRFVVSSLVLGAVLAFYGELPAAADLGRSGFVLLGLAVVALTVNYVLFMYGLDLTSPANAQILIQMAPLLLAIGGLVVFRERFNRSQWTGLALLIAGLGIFFSDQLIALFANAERYLFGCAVMFAASLTWAIYGLAQKQLLTHLPSQALMLCIYIGCALCLTPLAEPQQIVALAGRDFALLLYCALNTILGYGAFAAALEHLEASRVSAVIALTPVASFVFIAMTHALQPGLIATEHFSFPTLFGAGAVVAGSILTSRA